MNTASIGIAGWMALYFGLGMLRAGYSLPATSAGRGRSGRLLKIPGYVLIILGTAGLIFCVVRHWL